jgi:hypothetical protein
LPACGAGQNPGEAGSTGLSGAPPSVIVPVDLKALWANLIHEKTL